MNAADFEEFIRQIMKQDIVSEFDLFGIFEKIVTNIQIISDITFGLN